MRPRAEARVGGIRTHSPDTAWDALGCGWVLNVRLLGARDARPASSDSGVSRFRQLGHSEPHACVCVCVCVAKGRRYQFITLQKQAKCWFSFLLLFVFGSHSSFVTSVLRE